MGLLATGSWTPLEHLFEHLACSGHERSAVSGGMGAGRGRTLAERTAAGPAAPSGTPTAPEQVHGATHCWVQDPPEAPGRWPGLLLRWTRTPSGQWRGQVAYAFLRGADVVLVEATLDASLLKRR